MLEKAAAQGCLLNAIPSDSCLWRRCFRGLWIEKGGIRSVIRSAAVTRLALRPGSPQLTPRAATCSLVALSRHLVT